MMNINSNEKEKKGQEKKFNFWVETKARLLVNLDPYFVFNNDLKIVVSNNKKNLWEATLLHRLKFLFSFYLSLSLAFSTIPPRYFRRWASSLFRLQAWK